MQTERERTRERERGRESEIERTREREREREKERAPVPSTAWRVSSSASVRKSLGISEVAWFMVLGSGLGSMMEVQG